MKKVILVLVSQLLLSVIVGVVAYTRYQSQSDPQQAAEAFCAAWVASDGNAMWNITANPQKNIL